MRPVLSGATLSNYNERDGEELETESFQTAKLLVADGGTSNSFLNRSSVPHLVLSSLSTFDGSSKLSFNVEHKPVLSLGVFAPGKRCLFNDKLTNQTWNCGRARSRY